MNERNFCTEVVNSFKALGGFAYKIPDVRGARFTGEKPFDIIAKLNGLDFAIECKLTKKFGAFNFSLIRECQKEALAKYNKNNFGTGGAFIFLNVRQAQPRMNRLYVISWWEINKCLDLGETKISSAELKKREYISGAKGLFDLAEFWG